MDSECIRKLKSGDEGAFQTCVEAHQERVLNTCFRIVQDAHDAEEVAQDVFVEVHRSVRHFKEEAQLSTWIYRIAVNKSLDCIRAKKRKKRFGHLLSLFGGGEKDGREFQLPFGEDPHADLERQERITLLNRAVDSLPENQKVAITLSKYEGLRNDEIAQIMQTSLSAVESLIHRAKENLRKRLYAYYSEHV